MGRQHLAIYIIEFVIIGGGFSFLLAFNPPIYSQFIVMFLILTLYIGVGLFHHNRHHDMHLKVVLEYILVSAVIFALFIFLNIGRI